MSAPELPACPPVRLVLASSSSRRLDLLAMLGVSFEVIPSHVDEDIEIAMEPGDLAVNLALRKAREVADLLCRPGGAILSSAGAAPAGFAPEKSARNSVSVKIDEPGIISGAKAACRCLVLGADTTVVLDGDVLGKPKSRQQAYSMLSRLSGRCHRVLTGVAVIDLPDNEVDSGCVVSTVCFRALDDAEIRAYVATGEPMDKAGAYALQGCGSAFVEKIDGCFTNVIGLPVPLVVQILRRHGLSVLGLP